MHLVHLCQAIRRHGHPEAILFPEVAGDMAGWEDNFYAFIYIYIYICICIYVCNYIIYISHLTDLT